MEHIDKYPAVAPGYSKFLHQSQLFLVQTLNGHVLPADGLDGKRVPKDSVHALGGQAVQGDSEFDLAEAFSTKKNVADQRMREVLTKVFGLMSLLRTTKPVVVPR